MGELGLVPAAVGLLKHPVVTADCTRVSLDAFLLLGCAAAFGIWLAHRARTNKSLRVGGVDLLRSRRASALALVLHFDPDRRTTIEIPHSDDGRPGYTLAVPSDPYWIAVMNEDASRDDFCVMVGPHGSLNAVVLRPEAAMMTPEESALFTARTVSARGYSTGFTEPITDTTVVGESGVRYTYRLAPSELLTEWKFKRDGWMFVIGVRRPVGDDASLRLAEQCLATWSWTPAPPGYEPGMRWTHDRHGVPLRPAPPAQVEPRPEG